MTYKTKNDRKKEDTIRKQKIEIAWKMVSIMEELSNNLWSLFKDEFIERANKPKEEDIPF